MTSGPPPLLIEEEERLFPPRGVIVFFLSMVIAMVALIVVVLIWDHSPKAGLFLGIAFWSWIVVGAFLAFGPVTLAWRLRRTRAKRRQLLQAEWIVEDVVPAPEDAFRKQS